MFFEFPAMLARAGRRGRPRGVKMGHWGIDSGEGSPGITTG
jgi:hypothetical protein